jgi:two-component system sensor kinase FixL
MSQDSMDAMEVREILKDVADDGTRASEVIRRMRALARKDELDIAPLALSSVIREVALLVQSDAIVRGVHFSMELHGVLPVNGDRVQLQQVMLNLLLNAFDAVKDCPSGRRMVVVTAAVMQGGMVRVALRDSGVGLTADKLDKIFTPFFTSKRDGLGLGLSISRSIIEAHGGRLRAENNPDEGATFYFTLPMRVETRDRSIQTSNVALSASLERRGSDDQAHA